MGPVGQRGGRPGGWDGARGRGTAPPPPRRPRRGRLRRRRPGGGAGCGGLNPFKLRELNRRRARAGAAGFGLAALLFAVLGWATGQPAWFSSAVLLAILALVWGITSAFLGEGDRAG